MSAINVNSITGRTGLHGPVLTGVSTAADGFQILAGEFKVNGISTFVGMSTFNGGIDVASGDLYLSPPATGRLGVGTDSALRQFEVFNATHATAALKGNTQSSLFFVDSDDSNIGQISYLHADNDMYFRVNDAERLRITSDGKVGINSTSPGGQLCVTDTSTYTVNIGPNGGDGALVSTLGGSASLALGTDSIERLRIDSSGDVRFAGTNLTNSTNKNVNLTAPSWDTGEEDVNLIQVENEQTTNQISFGGGTSSLNSATTLRFLTASAVNTTTGVERLRIASDGNVGINESSPGTKLEVSGGQNQTANAFTDLFRVSANANNDGIGAEVQLNFGISPSHTDTANRQARIQAITHAGTVRDLLLNPLGGDVGIGTDAPAGLLHISGNTCQMHFTDEDDSASSRIYQSGATFAIDVDQADAKTSSVFAIRVDDAEQMKISSTGRVNVPEVYNTQIGATNRDLHVENTGQLGYVSSTRKSKGNITLLNNVNWLYQLQPSSFNYKVRDEDGELTDTLSAELEYGLIAEDVESVAPELCFYDEVDGQQELRGIHYKKLIVPLLKALQDANTKIETLETKVATLEGS